MNSDRKKSKLFLVIEFISVMWLCLNILTGCKGNDYINPGNHYFYSDIEQKLQSEQTGWYHDYFEQKPGNPYNDFIRYSCHILNDTNASADSKTEFDNLYDNKSNLSLWANFSDLNKELTETKLSESVKINVDWNQLFKSVNLNTKDISKADNLLLRFYNIISKVYHKDVILSLIQKVALNTNFDEAIARTRYFYFINAVDQEYSSLFANQLVLNKLYFQNQIVSPNIIVTIVHEMIHALCYYAMDTEAQRRNFNTYSIEDYPTVIDNSTFLRINNSRWTANNQDFNDVCSVFINFINLEANINLNNPVEKLIFPLLVVRSKYSETSWLINNVEFREELVAEGFARWITTDSHHRDYQWELLNKFFMEYFPNFYLL